MERETIKDVLKRLNENGVRYFSAPTCLHRPEVYSGIGESEAAALLRSFFVPRRQGG